MATSWFKFNGGSGVDPDLNPLNYTKLSTTPSYVSGSATVAFIFATTQIVSGVTRPYVPAVSPTGSVTISEIRTAKATNTSSPNCYVS